MRQVAAPYIGRFNLVAGRFVLLKFDHASQSRVHFLLAWLSGLGHKSAQSLRFSGTDRDFRIPTNVVQDRLRGAIFVWDCPRLDRMTMGQLKPEFSVIFTGQLAFEHRLLFTVHYLAIER